MRIHELAKEFGVSSRELLETLEKMGVAGKSASSSVPEDLVPRLRASGGAKPKPKAAAQKVSAEPAAEKAQPEGDRVEPTPAVTTSVPTAPTSAAPARSAPATTAPAPAPAAPTQVLTAPAPVAPAPAAPPEGPVLQVVRGSTPQLFAEKTNRSPADIVRILFQSGEMVTASTSLRAQSSR